MKAIEMITSSEGLGMSQRELWFPRQECKNDKKLADDES
jgi:hypothetical protein